MKDTSTWRSLEITATQTSRPRANPPSTRVTGESCNRITNFKEISNFLIAVFRVLKPLVQKLLHAVQNFGLFFLELSIMRRYLNKFNFYFQSALWLLRERRSRGCRAPSPYARVLRQTTATSPVQRQSLILLHCPKPSSASIYQLDA